MTAKINQRGNKVVTDEITVDFSNTCPSICFKIIFHQFLKLPALQDNCESQQILAIIDHGKFRLDHH
jgi:hypothetical protein